MLQRLAHIRGLRRLEISPGDGTLEAPDSQLPLLPPPAWLMGARRNETGALGREQLAALAPLKWLQHLSFPVSTLLE